ncbi:MFS transporter [Actinomadura luteofluorescens]|uniref:MFS transporter n=1 Tax=Actinomadura luteofluorescens TaxID=46163 RepID=UPI002164D94C|nr:MFS transporter [Actinomadura glauciflava]MCR3740461.1 putative arabinose efflux permease, MFS family [Actinomadura glauciflava]
MTLSKDESTRRSPAQGRWYRDVTRANRRSLVAAFLGWGFDGYETYALVVVLVPMMNDLLSPGQQADLPFWGGVAVGVTLLGWAIGGVIGGVVADYIGRKRVMLFSVAAYAVFAGLTALAGNLEMLLALRFLTGLSLGSEWGTGTALIAETWPVRARAKAAGIMQAGFGFGALLASGVWLVLGEAGPGAWRIVFLIGLAPALFTLYIRRHVTESSSWRHAKDTATARRRKELTLVQVFKEPESRRRVLLTLVLSLFSIGAYYTVSTSLPLFVKELAADQGRTDLNHLTSLAGMTYNVGSILGYVAGGFLADRIGRRPYIALYLVCAVATTALLYLTTTSLPLIILMAALNGFFTLGMFAAFAIYLPELFGASVRATAISFVFNSTRIVAAAGPIVFGELVLALGGAAHAAVILGSLYIVGLLVLPFLPETTGTSTER